MYAVRLGALLVTAALAGALVGTGDARGFAEGMQFPVTLDVEGSVKVTVAGTGLTVRASFNDTVTFQEDGTFVWESGEVRGGEEWEGTFMDVSVKKAELRYDPAAIDELEGLLEDFGNEQLGVDDVDVEIDEAYAKAAVNNALTKAKGTELFVGSASSVTLGQAIKAKVKVKWSRRP